jgi:hypothetical protein
MTSHSSNGFSLNVAVQNLWLIVLQGQGSRALEPPLDPQLSLVSQAALVFTGPLALPWGSAWLSSLCGCKFPGGHEPAVPAAAACSARGSERCWRRVSFTGFIPPCRCPTGPFFPISGVRRKSTWIPPACGPGLSSPWSC